MAVRITNAKRFADMMIYSIVRIALRCFVRRSLPGGVIANHRKPHANVS